MTKLAQIYLETVLKELGFNDYNLEPFRHSQSFPNGLYTGGDVLYRRDFYGQFALIWHEGISSTIAAAPNIVHLTISSGKDLILLNYFSNSTPSLDITVVENPTMYLLKDYMQISVTDGGMTLGGDVFIRWNGALITPKCSENGKIK